MAYDCCPAEGQRAHRKLLERAHLALRLPDLVKTVFNSLHEKVPFEDAFEHEVESSELDSSEVAMEIVDE